MLCPGVYWRRAEEAHAPFWNECLERYSGKGGEAGELQPEGPARELGVGSA